MKTVLFLCTGNYYRSRFAEDLFNFLAPKTCPGWSAASRGVAIDLGMGNTGPVSRFTARALVELGVDFDGDAARFPLQLKAEDLDAADCIVALKQAEHEPLMRARFAAWVAAAAPGRIAYWQVHDVDFAPPHLALPEIEARVRELIARLGA